MTPETNYNKTLLQNFVTEEIRPVMALDIPTRLKRMLECARAVPENRNIKLAQFTKQFVANIDDRSDLEELIADHSVHFAHRNVRELSDNDLRSILEESIEMFLENRETNT